MTDELAGSRLRLLRAAAYTSVLDRFSIAPLLIVIARDFDVSLGAVAVVASVHFLAYGAAQPIWAIVSDRFGRVATMRLSLLGAAAAAACSMAAPNLLFLGVARAAAGASMSAIIPTSLVYIADTWPAGGRQRALADIAVATAVGAGTATLAAGVVAEALHWRVAFGVPGAIAVVLWFALRRLPEPPRHPISATAFRSLLTVVRTPWARVLFAFAFVEGAVVMGLLPFLPAALQHDGVSATVAGLAASAYGVGVLAWSPVLKRMVGRRSSADRAFSGGCLVLLGWLGLSLNPTVLTVALAGLLLGGGWVFLHTTLQDAVSGMPPSQRATAVSLFAASLFVGSAAGAAVAAPLADRGAFSTLFALAGCAAAPLTFAVVGALRRPGAASQ